MLGRELKDTQLSVEFVAGLAYAAAFARLACRKLGSAGAGTALVSTQRPIRNDDEGGGVPTFAAAELDDPWAALARQGAQMGGLWGVVEAVEEGAGGGAADPRRLFPELQPCEQVCACVHVQA